MMEFKKHVFPRLAIPGGQLSTEDLDDPALGHFRCERKSGEHDEDTVGCWLVKEVALAVLTLGACDWV